MNPNVCADDINAIETTPIATTDGHIVGFTIRNSVQDEVKHGCVDEDDVMYREVVGLLYTQETGAIALAIFVILISET